MKAILLFLLTSVQALAVVTPNVPIGSNYYDVVDQLEAYGCGYSTFRIVRPQTFEDLRNAVYVNKDEDGCQAPSWLLKERSVIFRQAYIPRVLIHSLFSDGDELPLLGTEARLFPTFPLRQGRPTYQGGNIFTEIELSSGGGGDGDFGYAVAWTLGWVGSYKNYQSFLGRLYSQDAYVKAGYKWTELLVGRLGVQFGGAKHGQLLLSGINDPITMAKFSVRPHFWANWLKWLGPISFDTWVGLLGESSFVNESKVWAITLGMRPAKWLEFAILQLYQFGGDTAPNLDVGDLFQMLYYSGADKLATKRNRSLGVAVDVWAPNQSAKLYTQLYWSELGEIRNWFLDDISTLLGLWVPRLGSFDFRAEFVNTVPNAYKHSFWRQGLTREGSSLGHPLGPDAKGAYVDIGVSSLGDFRPVLGVLWETRNQMQSSGLATETRYGAGLSLQKRWSRTRLVAQLQVHSVKNHQYIVGNDNEVFAFNSVLEYLLF